MNKFAISSGGIGEALKRSAAALSEANNSLEESIALVTTANTVVQDPDSVGNAWKTVALRIRGAKLDLENAGLDTEGMVDSTAKLRDMMMAVAKVDILEDDEKTFRSTYDIMADLSKVWNDIDDEVQKSALLEALGGKRQSNIIAAVLNNGELLGEVYNAANDSLDSAMKEQQKWSKSLEASAGRIQAIFQSISAKVFDSKSLKSVFTAFEKLLNIIDKTVEKGEGLSVLLGSLGGIMGATGTGLIHVDLKNFNQAGKHIKAFNDELINGVDAQREYATQVGLSNQALGRYLNTQAGGTASMAEYRAEIVRSTVTMTGLRIATAALNAILNVGINLIISAGISAFYKLISRAKEAREEFQETTDTIRDFTKEANEYKNALDTIIDSEDDEATKIQKLNDLKDELSHKYHREIDDIKDVTEARKNLSDVIEAETAAERTAYLASQKDSFKKAVKEVTDGTLTDYAIAKDLTMNGKGVINANGKISDQLLSMFAGYEYSDRGGYGSTYYIDYIKDAENEIDYYYKLLSMIEEFDKYAATHKLNQSELDLYNNLSTRIADTKKALFEGDENYEDTIYGFARTQAEQLIYSTERGTKSLEEYKQLIVGQINNRYTYDEAQFIIKVMNEILDAEEKAVEKAKETASPLALISAELSQIATQISEIKSGIKSTDEQFEDLLKVIKNNNDMDKFFSSSEIIEILEKYPSLNNAILETTYGYKIEADALEALRKAKLEEQKTALIAMQQEAENNLAATRQKLKNYSQELEGIKTVVQAKKQLAHVEAILANANMFTPGIGRDTNVEYYTAQRALLQSFLDAEEKAEEYQKQLDALDIELQVLGKDSDDLSNSTNDATSALNKQKAVIKDLNDEYKKAQDDINDLIELTMDMIIYYKYSPLYLERI